MWGTSEAEYFMTFMGRGAMARGTMVMGAMGRGTMGRGAHNGFSVCGIPVLQS